MRNVANLVPPFTHSGVSVGAAVEYALTVLRVPHIIVCGHDGCGGIRASLDGLDKVAHLPSLHTWLEIASPAVAHARRTQLQGAELLRMAVEENVLYQMEHLITYPAVSAALEANTVQLHGWVFDMAEGTVRVYDVNREEFLRPDQLNTQTHIAAQP